LQVVYSLMEMREYPEATDYLEKVYQEIRAVSSVLRTKSAAVNALLQVKAAACQEAGIALELNIQSGLEGLAMPRWEFCRILGNLLDNAMEAAQAAQVPRIGLDIAENLRGFLLSVRNNGPAIPQEMGERIFEPGVSSKGEGRGMGLSIVRQTLEDYGGQIEYTSDEEETAFQVTVPKGTT
jgi:sensor histidine kinase regulating citrate/malate metabolism